MTTQLDLFTYTAEMERQRDAQRFDRTAALEAKQEGLKRAKSKLDPVWESYALATLKPFLQENRLFTPDDVRRLVLMTPRHHSHWPALLAKHEGTLWHRTNEEHTSALKSGHGNRVYRYESLVYRQPAPPLPVRT